MADTLLNTDYSKQPWKHEKTKLIVWNRQKKTIKFNMPQQITCKITYALNGRRSRPHTKNSLCGTSTALRKSAHMSRLAGKLYNRCCLDMIIHSYNLDDFWRRRPYKLWPSADVTQQYNQQCASACQCHPYISVSQTVHQHGCDKADVAGHG